jgi:hypothetical protein
MGGGDDATVRPFRIEIERWQHVGGGTDRDGNVINQPWPLMRARLIDNICQRYGCLPSQLMEEDTDLLFGIMNILSLVGDDSAPNKAQSMEEQLANLSRVR